MHNQTFPSRCTSAVQIVRPLESIAETQPKLQPDALRLSATSSQYFVNAESNPSLAGQEVIANRGQARAACSIRKHSDRTRYQTLEASGGGAHR
jgi:hypothetical protein